jgi:hypothetical protein
MQEIFFASEDRRGRDRMVVGFTIQEIQPLMSGYYYAWEVDKDDIKKVSLFMTNILKKMSLACERSLVFYEYSTTPLPTKLTANTYHF